MNAREEVHPDEGVTLAERVHLLEFGALHHGDMEHAGGVIIADLVMDPAQVRPRLKL